MCVIPSILVADDQLGVRRLLEELFFQVGYRVVTAAHGREAVVAATAERPSLALLDIRMPVMDGLEALRELRQLYPDLPVFMMTAVGDSERATEALSLGAQDCIGKPFDIFELRRLVQATLGEEASA
jgi:two-component system response regulator (stage 0 sporulation protein F)